MQYKFRGKRKDNGEWITGCLVSASPDEAFILIGVTGHIKRDDYECYMAEVMPETVGMRSTICDQNMNDIYEGDIIKVAGRLLNVVFDAGCFLSLWGANRYRLNQWGAEGVSIIGNIHDHPHLLNPAKGAVTHTMNTDPNLQPATPANQEPTTEQVQAVEQEAQEQAMESAEEGGAEG